MKQKKFFYLAILSVMMFGAYLLSTQLTSKYFNNQNNLLLQNVEALTNTDISNPKERHRMKLKKCYKTVDYHGYESKQLVGEHCQQSYKEDICDTRRVWGDC